MVKYYGIVVGIRLKAVLFYSNRCSVKQMMAARRTFALIYELCTRILNACYLHSFDGTC